MAKKNLIISAFTGYTFEQLRPYVFSIRDSVKDADLVMVIGQTDADTRHSLQALGWQIESAPDTKDIPIHVLRFLPMYNYLREHGDQYEYVVSTDVKDVIFQQDPFQWLEQNLGDKKLLAASESLRYCDEPWGDDNLRSCYGGYVYERFKTNTIYNVGTLGGRMEYMRDLFFNLFYNSIGRPIPIVDQAVYNVMLQTQPYRDQVLFADHDRGWACQAGTTVDPNKINWFRPKLLDPEPKWNTGSVTTSTGQEFVIVHQYDRIPTWRSYYSNYYQKMDFEYEYQRACLIPSDINEHLPVLSSLCEQCEHVTELGVGPARSTRAFLRHDVELHSYEITPGTGIEDFFQKAKTAGRRVTLHVADTRKVEIAETDLMLVDSLHIYEQVKAELELHASKVKKYLVFHDTTTYADRGEFDGRGIWPAIQEFLDSHPEWIMHERRTNNNGLTILKRV